MGAESPNPGPHLIGKHFIVILLAAELKLCWLLTFLWHCLSAPSWIQWLTQDSSRNGVLELSFPCTLNTLIMTLMMGGVIQLMLYFKENEGENILQLCIMLEDTWVPEEIFWLADFLSPSQLPIYCLQSQRSWGIECTGHCISWKDRCWVMW